MKQYIGKQNDDCFFYRCSNCLVSFLIEAERDKHESVCVELFKEVKLYDS